MLTYDNLLSHTRKSFIKIVLINKFLSWFIQGEKLPWIAMIPTRRCCSARSEIQELIGVKFKNLLGTANHSIFPQGDLSCRGGKKSKFFPLGSDFTDQIFTGELSGVDSAVVLRPGYNFEYLWQPFFNLCFSTRFIIKLKEISKEWRKTALGHQWFKH